MYKLLKPKAQLWYMDLVIALSMFLIVIVFSFKYLNESYIFENDKNIISEADKLTSKLLTVGIPENWTNEYVLSIGLTTENTLNTTKLEYLNNLSTDKYPNVKAMFGLSSDFIIFFMNRTGEMVNFSDSGYIGMPGKTQYNINAGERIDVQRYITYKHDGIAEILNLKVILWD